MGGDAINYYVEKAVKHVHLRQGVIGIKVKIMLPHDPTGENGVARDLPDAIKVHDPDKQDAFGLGGQPQPTIPDVVQPAYMSNMPATDVRNADAPQQMMAADNNDNDVMNDSTMQPPQQQMNDQPPQQMMQPQGGFGQQY